MNHIIVRILNHISERLLHITLDCGSPFESILWHIGAYLAYLVIIRTIFSQLFHINVGRHALQKVTHICVYRYISCILAHISHISHILHIVTYLCISALYRFIFNVILLLLHIVTVLSNVQNVQNMSKYVKVTAIFTAICAIPLQYLHNMSYCLGGKVAPD